MIARTPFPRFTTGGLDEPRSLLRRLAPWVAFAAGVLLLVVDDSATASRSALTRAAEVKGSTGATGQVASPALPSPLSMVGALVVVGAVLMAMPRWLRALQSRRVDNGAGAIRVVDVRSLGPRRSLILAEIEGQRVLIGSSEAGLSRLADLGTAEQPATSPSFGAALEQAREPILEPES